MRWATWTGVGVDRMGCAWLIRRWLDPEAQFVFVPEGSSAGIMAATARFIPCCWPMTSMIPFWPGLPASSMKRTP